MLRDNSGHDPGRGEQADFEIAKIVAAVHTARKNAIATAGTTRSIVEHMGVAHARRRQPSAGSPDMSHFSAEFLRILRRIAPTAPIPLQRSLKFGPYPAKLLAMQRAAS